MLFDVVCVPIAVQVQQEACRCGLGRLLAFAIWLKLPGHEYKPLCRQVKQSLVVFGRFLAGCAGLGSWRRNDSESPSHPRGSLWQFQGAA